MTSILKDLQELSSWRKQQQGYVSFVPTMGCLHEGHCQLIHSAKSWGPKEKANVLVSIFVNPLQFGPKEDFKSYPRNIGKDVLLATKAQASAVWIPTMEEIFPGGENSHFKIKAPSLLTSKLCGAHRNGHFDGVATVIARLLNLIKPNQIVLGEKDWQQLVIVRELIQALSIPVRVKGVATVRDKDGLALSSRNNYLTDQDRISALSLPKELAKAKKTIQNGNVLDLNKIRFSLEKQGLEVEYLEIVDPLNLQPTRVNATPSLLAAAVKCGETRLIDHTFLMTRNPIVAIDGPAGAGKSTVTKAFAEKMGLIYLDTGAMYRAVAWLILEEKIDQKDEIQVKKLLSNIELNFQSKGINNQIININGVQLINEIRSPEVTEIVPIIAAQVAVREALTKQQQLIGKNGGIVAEGRDIGTAVFPDADLKIFLTASAKERAQRRILDLQEKGFQAPTLDDLKSQIEKRDELDSNREISPLIKAEDATEIETDGISINDVIQTIEDLFRMKIPEEVWPSQ